MQLLLRFHKYDKFKNPVFIASLRKDAEIASFTKLRDYYEKIKDREYETSLPIYYDVFNQFTSVSFQYSGAALEPNATYSVDFNIIKTKSSKIYVNFHINNIVLVA